MTDCDICDKLESDWNYTMATWHYMNTGHLNEKQKSNVFGLPKKEKSYFL